MVVYGILTTTLYCVWFILIEGLKGWGSIKSGWIDSK